MSLPSGIAIVGGGFMGEALVRGLLQRGVYGPAQVVVAEPVPERRRSLQEQYGVQTVPAAAAAVGSVDTVLLAVKPQVLPAVLAELSGRLQPGQLVLSIVAGATLSTLSLGLRHEAVVRLMPNTPAAVGQSMTVWTAAPAVTEEQRGRTQVILGAMGREVEVDSERYLDMATALSGSGPGYVFLILEALIDAGVYLGFPRPVAQELVVQTVLGSALLAQETGKHPAELRNMVTTPGGTTAAGLLELEAGALRATLARAVLAAFRRSRELGRAAQEAAGR